MKNHWLQVYNKKNKPYWTAEFYSNSTYILSPRRVDLINFQKSFNGHLTLAFKNAVYMQSDLQLNLFLNSCRKYIDCYTSKICNYEKMNKIESFELYDLSFVSLNVSSNFEDIILIFNYQSSNQSPD
jgi:hypothetical protein